VSKDQTKPHHRDEPHHFLSLIIHQQLNGPSYVSAFISQISFSAS